MVWLLCTICCRRQWLTKRACNLSSRLCSVLCVMLLGLACRIGIAFSLLDCDQCVLSISSVILRNSNLVPNCFVFVRLCPVWVCACVFCFVVFPAGVRVCVLRLLVCVCVFACLRVCCVVCELLGADFVLLRLYRVRFSKCVRIVSLRKAHCRFAALRFFVVTTVAYIADVRSTVVWCHCGLYKKKKKKSTRRKSC